MKNERSRVQHTCKSLPQPTSDDLELRMCNYVNDEDKLISLVDIFIK